MIDALHLKRKLSVFKKVFLSLLLLGVLVFAGHHIIHEIIEIVPVDKPLPLVTGVHGGPAELVVHLFSLHEAPDGTSHDGDRLLVGHDEDLTHLVNADSLTEKLTCRWVWSNSTVVFKNDHCEFLSKVPSNL